MITFAAVAALLSCAGCIVTASTYDAKVRQVEALSKQVAGQKAALQERSSRADACEEPAARSAE